MHTRATLTTFVPTIFFTIAGCATTTNLTNVWSEPAVSGPVVRKTLMIGIAKSEVRRRVFEETMAARFKERGIDAAPSYQFLPALPDTSEAGKRALKSVIEENEFDTVLATRVLGVDRTTTHVPGTAYVVGPAYPSFHPYYWRSYAVVAEPGYTEQETTVILETNVYAVPGGSLLWAATSETIDPTSLQDGLDSFSAAVVLDLERRGFLKAP